MLELLAEKIDDDEPIHSRKALILISEIYDQSCDLFDKIEDLLPDRTDELSFIQKIKRNFKKLKVDLLVAEIEYLKSTVNLLVSVLYAGKKIRSYKRKRNSKNAQANAKAQYIRAQNAIIEQVNATSAREHLQAKAEHEEQQRAQSSAGQARQKDSTALVKPIQPMPGILSNQALVRFNESVGQATTSSEERALVVQNSMSLVTDLLNLWTNVVEDADHADQGMHKTRQDMKAAHSSATSPLENNDRGKYADFEDMPYQEPEYGSTSRQDGSPSATQSAETMREMYATSQSRIKELEAQLSRLETEKRQQEHTMRYEGTGAQDTPALNNTYMAQPESEPKHYNASGYLYSDNPRTFDEQPMRSAPKSFSSSMNHEPRGSRARSHEAAGYDVDSNEAMQRKYPMRERQRNDDPNHFKEVHQPSDAYVYREPIDEIPSRNTSESHADYEG